MNRHRSQQGFTLVELSISLLIIALLISGVMVGRSILRQSEITSIMADAQKYVSAVQAFQQKYNALPGDMATATNYWGIAAGSTGNDATCHAAGSTNSQATCNGDGNGQIAYVGSATVANETLRAWQHLANAGFIKGAYSGISGNAYDLLTNSPAGSASNLGFGIGYVGIQSGSANFFDGTYNHALFIGGLSSAQGIPVGATLTGAEGQALDNKYDDGYPALGMLRTYQPGAFANTLYCAVGNNAAATYNTASTQKICSMVLISKF